MLESQDGQKDRRNSRHLRPTPRVSKTNEDSLADNVNITPDESHNSEPVEISKDSASTNDAEPPQSVDSPQPSTTRSGIRFVNLRSWAYVWTAKFK